MPRFWNALSVITTSISKRKATRMSAIAYHKRILGVFSRQLLFGRTLGTLAGALATSARGSRDVLCVHFILHFPPFFGGELSFRP